MWDNALQVTNEFCRTSKSYGHEGQLTSNIFGSLPNIPQWLAISTSVLGNVLDFSVYARTAVYMFRHPEIVGLMKLDGVTQLPGRYTRFMNGLAYGFVALDTLFDIYTNIQQGKSAGYVIGSAAYTAVTGAGIVWASGKIGAAIGSLFFGPAGTLLGGFAGLLFGVGLSYLANWLKEVIFK